MKCRVISSFSSHKFFRVVHVVFLKEVVDMLGELATYLYRNIFLGNSTRICGYFEMKFPAVFPHAFPHNLLKDTSKILTNFSPLEARQFRHFNFAAPRHGSISNFGYTMR